MASIEEKVEELIAKKVEILGYELYDVIYTKEGKDFYLKIIIDKPEGLDLNDCEKVSNEINPMLDNVDYIKEQYFLEVSSPGIEKVLRKDKHLEDNIENKIEAKLFKAVEKEKIINGVLKKFNSENLVIDNGTKELVIERKNIAVIKTVYDW